jgi:NAD(P)H-dependent FMN reductase
MKILVIIASNRANRIGGQVGDWIADYTAKHTDFEVVVADLAKINLPLFDEPNHPRFQQYQHAHTKKWSKTVIAADGFIVVTPEYNFTMPPSLSNAIDYLYHEWAYKPVGYVGYGAGGGGLRAIQTAQQLFTNVSAVSVSSPNSVALSGIFRPAIETFEPTEQNEQAADRMLAELRKWAVSLLAMRQNLSN